VRTVIVGAGLMGRWHAAAAAYAGGRVVAVADPDSPRRTELGRRYRARAVATLDEALEAGADVVHVCAPLGSHAPLALAALHARCHVIVEKPAAPTATETRDLVEIARAAGRWLVPVHQFAFQDGVRRVLERLPELGHLRHVEFATCSAGAERLGAEGDRDAVAAEIVPHGLYLARRLLGADTASLPWQMIRPAPGEWRCHARGPGEVTVAVLISLRARPTFATVRVQGERGSAHADLFHGFAVFEPGTASRMYKVGRPVVLGLRSAAAATRNLARRALRRESAYPGLRTLIAAAYDAARVGGPPPITAEETLDVAAARDRLMELVRQAS
jgi:predicted dehydrogenase